MRATTVIKLLEMFGICECGNDVISSDKRSLHIDGDIMQINCNMCGKDVTITYEER